MEIGAVVPHIPDHEVLRCIGKGSYGEVWLARAVTGTLRAVKVVRREDFELDRTFEREFEGIMKFEPVSREHPGLVQVLHVGRNDEEKFYFYVMELGDDKVRGSTVDAADYESRTLGTDKALKHRLPILDCIENGAQIAEGLAHLHECGLTHRDIKPANIIFVNGKAKLADIGLVATAGQMTFVGTEGFVPPEGPGTKLADIYSLGMVLYELATGKDRLEFPELPDDPGDSRTRPQRQALNAIILKACALQAKKRFSSAREMGLALRAAKSKRPKGQSLPVRLITLPVATAAAAFAIVTWQHNGAMPWPPGRFAEGQSIAPPPPARTGKVRLQSVPQGAAVERGGVVIGRTPFIDEAPAGLVNYVFRRKQYRDAVIAGIAIEADVLKDAEIVELQFHNPPKPGQPWENSLEMIFDPQENGHISRRAVSYDQFQSLRTLNNAGVVVEYPGPNEQLAMVYMQKDDALGFCDALTQRESQLGWLTPDLSYRPEIYVPKDPQKAKTVQDSTPGEQNCFRLVVEKYGTITLNSEPQGAAVYEGGLRKGNTPWTMPRQRPGELTFRLVLPGFSESKFQIELKSGASVLHTEPLKRNQLPVFGKEWKNSLGIPFRPIPPEVNILAAAWETRVVDYAEFARETNTPVRLKDDNKDGKDDLEQGPNHPVVNITRAEARDFCKWLTSREREKKFLDSSMEYRLPSDAEWSLAAGSGPGNENQRTPAQRHMTVSGIYPWRPAYQFPPPRAGPASKGDKSKPQKAAANLGDLTALKKGVLGDLKPWQNEALVSLPYKDLESGGEVGRGPGYDDGVVFTSPVGQFAPVGTGLFDLSGNVWEFVEEDYGVGKDSNRNQELRAFAVVRGGGWNTLASEAEKLATQYRKEIPPDTADIFYGFRVMVALTPAAMASAAAAATPPPAASTSPLPSAFPDPTIFDESTSD